jgi:type VI secretion system protein ImpA
MSTDTATIGRLDVEALLEPLPGPDPSGRDLEADGSYDELREARRSEDDALPAPWQKSFARWDRVIDQAAALLRHESKDVTVAVWLTEALTQRRGLSGLADGLQLLSGLLDRYWDTCYPRAEGGDLELRYGPWRFLNATLPVALRQTPLIETAGPLRLTLALWQEARATQQAGLRNAELRAALVAEGKMAPEAIHDAIAQVPPHVLADTARSARSSMESLDALDAELAGRFGPQGPRLTSVRVTLEEVAGLLDRFVKPAPGDAAVRPSHADSPPLPHDERTSPHAPAPGLNLGVELGQVVIDLCDAARELADLGAQLAENRRRREELVAEMARLDDDYRKATEPLASRAGYPDLLVRLRGAVRPTTTSP